MRRAVAGLAGAAALIAVVTVAQPGARLRPVARPVRHGRVRRHRRPPTPRRTRCRTSSSRSPPAARWRGRSSRSSPGRLARGLRADVDRIASAMLGWALAVLVPLAGAARAARRTDRRAAGRGPHRRRGAGPRAVVRARVRAARCPLYGVGVVLVGVLQAHHRFLWPALAPVFSSVVVIGAYLAYGALARGEVDDPTRVPDAALAWLGWGTTAGVAAMSLPLLRPAAPDRGAAAARPCGSRPGSPARARSLAFAGHRGARRPAGRRRRRPAARATAAAGPARSRSSSTPRPCTCCRTRSWPSRSPRAPSRGCPPGPRPATSPATRRMAARPRPGRCSSSRRSAPRRSCGGARGRGAVPGHRPWRPRAHAGDGARAHLDGSGAARLRTPVPPVPRAVRARARPARGARDGRRVAARGRGVGRAVRRRWSTTPPTARPRSSRSGRPTRSA